MTSIPTLYISKGTVFFLKLQFKGPLWILIVSVQACHVDVVLFSTIIQIHQNPNVHSAPITIVLVTGGIKYNKIIKVGKWYNKGYLRSNKRIPKWKERIKLKIEK